MVFLWVTPVNHHADAPSALVWQDRLQEGPRSIRQREAGANQGGAKIELFARCIMMYPYPYANHGAGIYTYMTG